MASGYSLRNKERIDYRVIEKGVEIPRARRATSDKLYPITVVETNGDQVKIHYEGYGEEYDEWRSRSDIVEPMKPEMYKPYDPHQELAYQIKLSLDSRGRRDPEARIELPFDKLVFEGG